MKNLVIFCGSSEGYHETYREAAYETGAYLAHHDYGIVYGGAQIGNMGAVADGALNNGGRVIGVIPGFLKTKEVVHTGITELIEVETMHERKMKMFELSDGSLALPGGWGTLEELFEMMTWAQLGLHQKPIGILNINGFYDPLLAQLELMTNEGFLKEIYREMILVDHDLPTLIGAMEEYQAPEVKQWITKSKT